MEFSENYQINLSRTFWSNCSRMSGFFVFQKGGRKMAQSLKRAPAYCLQRWQDWCATTTPDPGDMADSGNSICYGRFYPNGRLNRWVEPQAGERDGAMAPSQVTASGSARRLFERFTARFRNCRNYFRGNGQVPPLALWCRDAVPYDGSLLEPQRILP